VYTEARPPARDHTVRGLAIRLQHLLFVSHVPPIHIRLAAGDAASLPPMQIPRLHNDAADTTCPSGQS
jgi:hypothetical protein